MTFVRDVGESWFMERGSKDEQQVEFDQVPPDDECPKGALDNAVT
jgi:hypothetical protein